MKKNKVSWSSVEILYQEFSFQDESYKPWHIVVYYRMLRFFADGSLLCLLLLTVFTAKLQISQAVMFCRRFLDCSFEIGIYNEYNE